MYTEIWPCIDFASSQLCKPLAWSMLTVNWIVNHPAPSNRTWSINTQCSVSHCCVRIKIAWCFCFSDHIKTHLQHVIKACKQIFDISYRPVGYCQCLCLKFQTKWIQEGGGFGPPTPPHCLRPSWNIKLACIVPI